MKRKYTSLLGALLLHLTLGNLNTSGNLIPYLASYMRQHVNSAIGHAEAQWVGYAGQVAFGFFSVLGGQMERAIGTKLACLVGSIILSYNLLLSYSTVQTSLPLLVVTYGFNVGLGTTIAYCVPIYASMQWFPTYPGLVSGVVMSGYYIGYMSSMLLQMRYLNPLDIASNDEGYFDDPSLLNGVPTLFVWMAGVSFLLQLCGVALLSRPPPEYRQLCSNYPPIGETTSLLADLPPSPSGSSPLPHLPSPSGSSPLPQRRIFPPPPGNDEVNNGEANNEDARPRDIIRSFVFRILWLTYLVNSVVGVSIITTYKSFGQTFITDDTFLTSIGCLGALMNALGSVFWGYVNDKTSYKTTMLAITTILTICVGTLPAVTYLGRWAYVVWGLTLYFTTAGNYVVMPAIMHRTFGATHAATNIGVLFTSQGVAALIVALGMQTLLHRINYAGCYSSQAVLTALGFIFTLRLPNGL